MDDWQIAAALGGVTALCALCTLAGGAAVHFYKRGKFDSYVASKSRGADSLAAAAIGKIDLLRNEFHTHVTDDAEKFGRLEAMVGGFGREQLAIESRFTSAMEGLSRSLADLGRDLRTSMDGLSRRIDRAIDGRDAGGV